MPAEHNASQRQIGMLLFPALTQIDFTEPYEVFSRLPGTAIHIVAKTLDPVRSERGLMLVPTVTCAACPPLDVLVVPGGPGQHHARNRVTASGCTAGLDFALQLAAMLAGDAIAQHIQLQLEYCPAPPFASGSPRTAPEDIVATVRRAAEPFQQQRRQAAIRWREERSSANRAAERIGA